VHALAVERLLPGQHVLVDAVDEGAVEVEQEGGGRAWHGRLLVVGVRGVSLASMSAWAVVKALANPHHCGCARAPRNAGRQRFRRPPAAAGWISTAPACAASPRSR